MVLIAELLSNCDHLSHVDARYRCWLMLHRYTQLLLLVMTFAIAVAYLLCSNYFNFFNSHCGKQNLVLRFLASKR